jgi:hypothetical protein
MGLIDCLLIFLEWAAQYDFWTALSTIALAITFVVIWRYTKATQRLANETSHMGEFKPKS